MFREMGMWPTLFVPEIRAEMWQHLSEQLRDKEKASLTGRLSDKSELYLLVVPCEFSFLTGSRGGIGLMKNQHRLLLRALNVGLVLTRSTTPCRFAMNAIPGPTDAR